MGLIVGVDISFDHAIQLWRVDITNTDGEKWNILTTERKSKAIEVGERFTVFANIEMTVCGDGWLVP